MAGDGDRSRLPLAPPGIASPGRGRADRGRPQWQLRGRWRSPKVLLVLLLCQAVAMAACGAYPDVSVVVPGLAVAGVAAGISDVIVMSFRQHVVPDRLLARVTSGFRLVGIGATPISASLGGALAAAFGLRMPYFRGRSHAGPGWGRRDLLPARAGPQSQRTLTVEASKILALAPGPGLAHRPAQRPAVVTCSAGACGRPGRG